MNCLIGTEWIIKGLQNQSHYNDQLVKIKQCYPESLKFHVQTRSGLDMKIKIDNLRSRSDEKVNPLTFLQAFESVKRDNDPLMQNFFHAIETNDLKRALKEATQYNKTVFSHEK